MKTIKSILHTIGIIWSTAMTILAIEGWIAAYTVVDNKRQEEKKRAKECFNDLKNE